MCPFEKSATALNYLILVVHLGTVSIALSLEKESEGRCDSPAVIIWLNFK